MTLFEGTVRSNIDPFEEYTDERILEMLRLCLLPNFALDQSIAEDGKNLSLGNQQLLCLCRALIRNPSLCLMDESMSSIDVVSESAVLNVVQSVCHNTSLVLVAHRLSSLSLIEHVIVMEAGSIVEEGSPVTLKRQDSRFRALVDAQSSFATASGR